MPILCAVGQVPGSSLWDWSCHWLLAISLHFHSAKHSNVHHCLEVRDSLRLDLLRGQFPGLACSGSLASSLSMEEADNQGNSAVFQTKVIVYAAIPTLAFTSDTSLASDAYRHHCQREMLGPPAVEVGYSSRYLPLAVRHGRREMLCVTKVKASPYNASMLVGDTDGRPRTLVYSQIPSELHGYSRAWW